jgi:hypothetical protein
MRTDGIEIIEHDDDPDTVSFKCLDPDGHRVEVYWEPQHRGGGVGHATGD